MSRGILVLILIALAGGDIAHAQTLRLRSTLPHSPDEKAQPSWSTSFRYGALTDFADNRMPRDYTNSLRLSSEYRLDQNWSIGGELSANADMVGGHIDKGPQQSYNEVLNTGLSVEVDYGEKLDADGDSYGLFAHVDPLFDEPSRLEGYKAVTGLGGSIDFSFFDKTYTMSHVLDLSGLINSFRYAADGSVNPDYFATYKFVNALKFWGNNTAAFVFGIKTTRYLDGFTGYNYSSEIGLSHAFGKFSVSVGYEDGGFTQNGDVSLWYLDKYRRIMSLSAYYVF